MTARTESDERYILDLVAQVLAEPDYRWQHRFPTLLGDPGADGRQRPLPVDGYFPRHRLVVEYWEKQHSAPVPIMDSGPSISGVSKGHQRRLYDQRRQNWARANGLRFVILDYRGFEADELGRLRRNPARDVVAVAEALRAAGVLGVPQQESPEAPESTVAGERSCYICGLVAGDGRHPVSAVLWQDQDHIALLSPCPLVHGHALVAPSAHIERVTADLTLHGYLALHRLVYALAEATRLALRPESLWIMSTGGQDSRGHLCWHILPLPPGLSRQQVRGVLLELDEGAAADLPSDEIERLAERVRAHLPDWMRSRLGREGKPRDG